MDKEQSVIKNHELRINIFRALLEWERADDINLTELRKKWFEDNQATDQVDQIECYPIGFIDTNQVYLSFRIPIKVWMQKPTYMMSIFSVAEWEG